jgi:hypothetical protein
LFSIKNKICFNILKSNISILSIKRRLYDAVFLYLTHYSHFYLKQVK